MPYRTLKPEHIIATARGISERINDRFPEAGLSGVGREMVALARDIVADTATIDRPILWLRAMIGVVVAIGAAGTTYLAMQAVLPDNTRLGAIELVQAIEAGMNVAVLVGAGLFTLVKLEERVKRQRALKGLHGLRSLIHVIDMHQLTKDPMAMTADYVPTRKSPQRRFSPAELVRYLDYCSEMIAVTGKLAALYAQALSDLSVVQAVNDIENLGSNLSRKVWQKIALIDGKSRAI